jgi:hypothetical protein
MGCGGFRQAPERHAAIAKSTMPCLKKQWSGRHQGRWMPSASQAPVCKTGKPCGKSCIAKDKVCHKTWAERAIGIRNPPNRARVR